MKFIKYKKLINEKEIKISNLLSKSEDILMKKVTKQLVILF